MIVCRNCFLLCLKQALDNKSVPCSSWRNSLNILPITELHFEYAMFRLSHQQLIMRFTAAKS